MSKQNRQLVYSIGVVIVLIGVLYVVSGVLSGEKIKSKDTVVELKPVAENSAGEANPENMYLGMKTWNWVKAKDDGKEILPSGDTSFTLSFDFNTGKFSLGTDCNSGAGSFTAASGKVSFGEIAATKKFCEGSQEGAFMGLISKAEGFYFTSKGEMVLMLTGGGTATFR
jgi:heat shock protein HslJ